VKWFGTTTDIDEQQRYAQQQEQIASALSRIFEPYALPVLPQLAFDAVYVPAEDFAKVGGDFYEALVLPDGRVLVAIGDVAGHGLPAAVTMGRVRNAIVAAALDGAEPSAVLAKVNRILLFQETVMVTAAVGFIDPVTGTYEYASAGHAGPIVAGPAGARVLDHGGIPLAVEREATFPTFHGRLAPGEWLLLATDGIVEFDHDPVAGEHRLLEAARLVAGAPCERPAEAVYRAVLGERRSGDDVAMLTVAFGVDRPHLG
jgi:serine phosphatase RsbU (regulator of sigma subunit)